MLGASRAAAVLCCTVQGHAVSGQWQHRAVHWRQGGPSAGHHCALAGHTGEVEDARATRAAREAGGHEGARPQMERRSHAGCPLPTLLPHSYARWLCQMALLWSVRAYVCEYFAVG